MKLMHLAVAVAIAILSAPTDASANDITENITGLGGTTFFGALHTDSSDFSDVFTFSVSGTVLAEASLITIGADLSNIDFLTADLNGNALTLSPTGFIETGTIGTLSLTGPLVLTVTGKSGAAAGTFASYSGTMNVALVPEPGTALLVISGLAGLGVMGRRRDLR